MHLSEQFSKGTPRLRLSIDVDGILVVAASGGS